MDFVGCDTRSVKRLTKFNCCGGHRESFSETATLTTRVWCVSSEVDTLT